MDINVEDLLANTAVTDIEDLPEFVAPANGLWNLQGKAVKLGETKAKNAKVTLTFALGEPVELTDPDSFEADQYPANSLVAITAYGTEGDPLLFLKQLKKMFKPIFDGGGFDTIHELLEQFDSLSFIGVMVQKPDSDNPTIVRAELKEAHLAN